MTVIKLEPPEEPESLYSLFFTDKGFIRRELRKHSWDCKCEACEDYHADGYDRRRDLENE